MVRNVEEEYEKEFLEFLIQKIGHAGGSLQFQHLSGLLHQLRFEIRDAFGVTKPALMRFLKAHANTFEVNSKGMVTVISAVLDSNENVNEEEGSSIWAKKPFMPKLINGKGVIFKIFPQYAIIKAKSPVNSYVFFTPVEYGGEKDSIFTDFNLSVRDKVSFNAIHGHNDYEIQYRATKVWCSSDSDEENKHAEDLKRNRTVKTEKITGEGIIKELYPTVGFIAVSNKGSNKDIFFYRSNVKDRTIRKRDRVEFTAEFISNEWVATEVIKKRKENTSQLSSSQSPVSAGKSTEKHITAEEKVINELGKIYPYSKGAIIKFGKNYTELADGNACNFYLYGIKVDISDIEMEFSEGDDVNFDAIKPKNSPGWKAVLAWVGEKPANAGNIWKNFVESRENSNDHVNAEFEETASDVSSEISDLISRTKKHKNNNKELKTINKKEKLNNNYKTQLDNSRHSDRVKANYKTDIGASKKVSTNISYKGSQYSQSKGRNRSRNRSHNRFNQEKSFSKRFKNSDNNKPTTKKYFDGDLLESSETASEENNELQDSPRFTKKFLVEDKRCEMELQESMTDDTYTDNVSDEDISRKYLVEDKECNIESSDQESLTSEIDSDNESDEHTSENREAFAKGKSSIKNFEAIDGEIKEVHCKFAMVESNNLKKEVEFILNAFYLDGKSVEEQHVTDLREVIRVGDIIKFNCFEIIDNFGEIHQKVTMAWKGPKPEAFEIKPEEFISEHDLRVTIDNEHDYECDSEESFDTAKSSNFENTSELNLEAEISLNNVADDVSCQYSVVSKSKMSITDESYSELKPENLPDRIFKKLESYGFTSSEPEVVLNVVQEIIELVLKNSNIETSSNLFSKDNISTVNGDSGRTCSYCGQTNKPLMQDIVNTEEAGVQTIVTGEIFSASIFPEED